MSKRICIVTSGHVASDPRVVKSADALSAAGYDVCVVSIDVHPELRERDASVLEVASWRCLRAGRGGKFHWTLLKVREHLCRHAWRLGFRGKWLAEQADGRMISRLASLARSTGAELFVGHNLPGLVAAGRAAEKTGAMLAFDAEDDHPGEIPDVPGDPAEVERRYVCMNRWMRRCVFRTTAAPMMATRLRERFGVDFMVLLNVFPLADAEGIDSTSRPQTPSIYWFSQTVGLGRGLEELVSILARCSTPFVLQMRGSPSVGYQAQLMSHAVKEGMATERLIFLPPADPQHMSRLSAGHSLGASVEIPNCENRRVCLGNKIFQYLLGGVPVLMSNTPAQSAFANELGEAALLVDLTDVAGTARRLDEWYSDTALRERSAQRARALAHERFNWDREQHRLLELVSQAFSQHSPKHERKLERA